MILYKYVILHTYIYMYIYMISPLLIPMLLVMFPGYPQLFSHLMPGNIYRKPLFCIWKKGIQPYMFPFNQFRYYICPDVRCGQNMVYGGMVSHRTCKFLLMFQKKSETNTETDPKKESSTCPPRFSPTKINQQINSGIAHRSLTASWSSRWGHRGDRDRHMVESPL